MRFIHHVAEYYPGANDFFFLLALAILSSIARGLVRIIASRYKAGLATQADQERLDPVITADQRFANFILLFIALSTGLVHSGANASRSGLIVSPAAKQVISCSR